MGNLVKLSTGRSIYFSENGNGPGLLCLHGLGGGAYFFAGLADALKDRFRTVAVDLPGCGFSPPGPSGFSFEDSIEVVQALVNEKMSGPIAILGHSMGTIVALEVAARGLTAVSRLVFVGGLPRPTPEAQQRLAGRAREVREKGMLGVGDVTMPIVFSQSSLGRIADQVAMYHRLLELNHPVRYAEAAEELSRANAWDVVSRITVPCLAITGSEDRYAPPGAVTEFVRQLPGPVEYQVLPECGHMPFFEKPEVFYELVEAFLWSSEPDRRGGTGRAHGGSPAY